MTITAGHTGSATGTGLLSPTWSAAPITGSMLILAVNTSRSTLTYFGNGNADPSGWTKFGDSLWPTQSTKSCAQYWRIADGTSLDSPSIRGYSDTGRTTAAGTNYASMIELQDGVSGGACHGRWDVTNTLGLGGTAAIAGAYTTIGTSLTLGVTSSSWTETAYTEAALLCVGRSNATLSGTSGYDSGQPFAGTFQTLGIKSGLASGASNSFVDGFATSSTVSMSAFVIGFTPYVARTATQTTSARIQASPASPPTQPTSARIQSTPAPTQPAGAMIASPSTFAGTRTQAAGAVVSISPTPAIIAGAVIKIAGVAVQPAGALLAGPPWSPLILMGTGNNLTEALGTAYFVLSGDLDGGGGPTNTGATDSFTYVIDGGQAI